MNNCKIGVVLVTFNRLSKLKKAVQCYASQNTLPSYMIIVDNASSDGTKEFLDEWKQKDENFKKILVELPENIGGSGGFYEGLKHAAKLDADWIWVADDDAYPEYNCFSIAIKFLQNHQTQNISALCGAVMYDRNISLKHRRRTFASGLKFRTIPVCKEEYNYSNFKLNTYSFVGAILNREKLKLAGLPKRDYFIWNDDTEHSLRMSKIGDIICIPSMQIIHEESSDSRTFSWKMYYSVRNYLDMIRSNFSFFFFFIQLIKTSYVSFRAFLENKQKGILYLTAIKDALMRNFGLHKKYRPGWKIN